MTARVAAPSGGGDLLEVSVCAGKSQKQVKKLIAGPGVYICNVIDLCNEIIEEELAEGSEVDLDELPKPREIFEFLNSYVMSRTPGRGLAVRSAAAAEERVAAGRPAGLGQASRGVGRGRPSPTSW